MISTWSSGVVQDAVMWSIADVTKYVVVHHNLHKGPDGEL